MRQGSQPIKVFNAQSIPRRLAHKFVLEKTLNLFPRALYRNGHVKISLACIGNILRETIDFCKFHIRFWNIDFCLNIFNRFQKIHTIYNFQLDLFITPGLQNKDQLLQYKSDLVI